jgi:hypothetical protein
LKQLPADLSEVIQNWHTTPDSMKNGILAMVRASSGQS